MGASLDIPAELLHFLHRSPPQSLLVRGAPGTGKTTLALEILRVFQGRKVYVSGRVRRSDLVADFPSLDSAVRNGSLSIVEAVAGGPDLAAAARALRSAKELVVPDPSMRSLQALLLPPEVLEAWSQASPSVPTIVVLDSWDAIVEKHLASNGLIDRSLPAREELERLAFTQMAEGPVFLVMVVEHREAAQLEYLVNGVVTLEREVRDGRMERWLRFDKLRGTRIAHPSYPFSLEGGRFQCIEPLRTNLRPDFRRADPEPGHSPGQIWPGSSDYAARFGWLPVHQLTLVEHDADVPLAALNLLLNPIQSQVFQRGGRIFIVPPPGMHPVDLWNLYQERFPGPAFSRQVRILGVSVPGEPEELTPAMLPLPSGGAGGFSPRTPEAAKFLSEHGDRENPNLGVIWIEGLKAINALAPGTYDADTLPGLALTYLRQSPLHMVWVGPEDEPLTRSLRSMARTRLRLHFLEGRVFVHGRDPRTPWLVLSEGDDQTPYRLLVVA